jgi:hypothetical protein
VRAALSIADHQAVLADALLPRATLVQNALLVVTGSLLVALCSQISLPLPFSPVPVTGQTFAVLLLGATLGARRSAAALILYLAQGIAGLPVFAPGVLPARRGCWGPPAATCWHSRWRLSFWARSSVSAKALAQLARRDSAGGSSHLRRRRHLAQVPDRHQLVCGRRRRLAPVCTGRVGQGRSGCGLSARLLVGRLSSSFRVAARNLPVPIHRD